MSFEIEKLKNTNKYYLNMYGEIEEVPDWCFTTGIINEMQPQGNVFNSEKEAVKDILEALPKGSAKVIDEPIVNTVVIRIQKNVFMEE